MAGLLGTQFQTSLKRSDFFTFFHLEVDDALSDESQSLAALKPSGASFRDLVTVYCTLDARDRIEGMELRVARSFIDDPKIGAFAADISKSFLHSIAGSSFSGELKELAEDIEFRAGTSRAIVVQGASRDSEVLARQPSTG